MKIYYRQDKFSLNSDQIIVLFQVLISFINSGIDSHTNKTNNEPCLLLPGVDELMMNIGEGFSILLEINYQLSLNSDLSNLTELLRFLLDNKIEYSINLMEGISAFLKTKNNLDIEILRPIFGLLKKKCFDSIIKSKSINNYLDLKSV